MVIKEQKKAKGGKDVPKVTKEKEKCVCEICTCGRHRCPHNNFRGTDPNTSHSEQHAHSSECATTESREQYKAYSQVERQKMKRPQTALRVEGGDKMDLSSSYREEFHEKEMEELKRFKHQDHVHWPEDSGTLEDSAVGGLRSRSMLRERTGTGGPDDNWGIHMHEDYRTGSRDDLMANLDSGSGRTVQGTFDTSRSTHSLSESQSQQQMSSSMTSSMLSKSQQNVSDSTTFHDIMSTDIGAGATGGDGKFMTQLQDTTTRTKKQLRGGKLIDVPDTSRTYSEAVSSTSKSESKYSTDYRQTDEDVHQFERSDTLRGQGLSTSRTGADGQSLNLGSSTRQLISSSDGQPGQYYGGPGGSLIPGTDSYDITQGVTSSTSAVTQSAYSTNQLITERDNQRYEQTSSTSENMAAFEKIGPDGKPIRTATSSRQVTSSADGTPIGVVTFPHDPAGPRKIIRGGKLETVPAEAGYYEQVLKSSVAKGSQRDSSDILLLSGDVHDSSNVYSQDLNTSTSSVRQSTYSTDQHITERDNQRYEQTSKVSENIASYEKTGPDGKPIRTSTSSREVATSSDGTPIGPTGREPSGPRKIIRGGKLEHIPAEPGYYDQQHLIEDFNTSVHSEYSNQQVLAEQSNQRYERSRGAYEQTAAFETIGTDEQPVRTSTTSREVISSSDGTPFTPTTSQKEPAGPRKILRGGKLEYIPAEPGYYDQQHHTEDFNTSTTSVSQSEYSTQQLMTEQDNQRYEQTRNIYDQTAAIEKTGRDGKPIRTSTTSREVVSTSDGTPFTPTTSQKEPAGPRKILRGGKVEYIPAEPGYYDQQRLTEDFNTSTTSVSQLEYSTHELMTEQDNQRYEQSRNIYEQTAAIEKTGRDGKPIRTSTTSREVISSSDGTPFTPTTSQKEPAGPRKILRGGKLEYIPAEPGYYEQTPRTTSKTDTRKDTSDTFSSTQTTRTTGQQQISESERIIEESSSSLKHLGDQLTDREPTQRRPKPTKDGRQPGKGPTSVITRSQFTDDQSTIDNIHETSSTTIDERSSTSRFIDNVTDISETTTIIARPEPRETRVRGSNFETMSSGVIHDYGDVQGITVVSSSKTTMDQTVDQQLAQAELQKLTTAKTVYGVDIESTLARSRVKAVHEKEISSGTVRIGTTGIETTENVVKSVTEIKTARVSSATSKDTVEVDEKIHSSTTSTDQQTFKFSEITDKQAHDTLTETRRRNDVMYRPGTHESIDYTDTYKNQLDKKEVLKTGQVLVEELYDTKTSFESMDKDRVKTRAIQDENLRTTTILEKSEEPGKPKPEPEYYAPVPRTTPIRQPSNLTLEGSVDYTSTNRTDFNQKTTDRVKAVRRNTYTKQEGDMYLQTTMQSQFTPQVGDRYGPKKPVDQITVPEGTFSKRPEDTIPKGERSEKVYHKDSKFFDGQFVETTTSTKEDYRQVRGERAEVHKTPDNLRPEGDFYVKPKDDAPKMGERAPIKKPVDNLTSSGDKFYERPKEEAPVRGERAPVKRPVDQFPVSEGPFYSRPEQTAPLKGDRADIKRPVDNLTNSDAKFYVKPTETPGPGEKRQPIRQKDNLRPEGDFHSPKKEPAPTVGDRAQKKIPKDQISIPEGTFPQRVTETTVMKGERAEKVYHKDATFFEGKFDESTTSKHDFRQVIGERAEVHRAPDNLKPEGQFYVRPKETAPTGEKRKPIKQSDNLYPEGQFYSPTKEPAPVKGDRADIRKPVDQIGLSTADFTKRPEDAFPTGEKRKPIKQHDNLYPEGQFYSPTKDAAPLKGDRADIKKPVDQIGLSNAEFTKRPEDAAPTGEKRRPIKQNDNLYPEGQFYSPTKEPAPTRGDRADIKKPVDQIGLSTADFTKRPEDAAPTGEKRRPIKQNDNLYPEGQFYSPPKEAAPTRGDRADIKKPVDQIGLSNADFTKRPEDVIPAGEKRKPIKQSDNLYPEGQFYSPPKEAAPTRGDRADVKKPVDQIGMSTAEFTKRPEDAFSTGEKRQPIKQHDNLYPEGQFYSKPKETAPTKGDRADIKKPVDQIGMSTAEFTKRPEDAFPTGEKRQPIKQHDNLYPEGQFYSPPKEAAPTRGDRADIKKPVDQIGLSTADFTKRPEDTVPTGEKRRPIKQNDNLYPEGQFYSPSKEAAPTGEKRQPIKQADNLYPEGQFYSKPKEQAPTKGERADVKKPVDQIGMSTAEFTKRPEDVFPTGEKRQPIKQHDNLYPEGQFYSPPKETAPTKGDRADIKKPVDQIGMSTAEFTKRPEVTFPAGEKRQPIKQHDNLYPEGQFYSPPKETAPTRGDRADIKKPVDQIGLSTADFTKRPEDTIPTGEKRRPIKQTDNLYPEGQFYSPSKEAAPTGEKRQPIKQADNLYPEGQFYSKPKEQAPTKGERADVKKPVDQIGMSTAEFTKRPEDVFPTGEKRQPIKQHDNLYPEGQFYSPPKEAAPLKGDRADMKRPVDQIGMSTADFTRRPEDVFPTGEKRQPIKQHDNLYPEGQFYSPSKEAAPTGEKRQPIKQADNLYPEGQFYSKPKEQAPTKGERADVKKPVDQIGMSTAEFTKRPEDAFPTGEKRQPIKQHDNLYPEGQFYSPEKEPAPTRGERADIKKPVDQIEKPTGEFTRRPEDEVPTGEKRRPIKQQDNLYPEGQFYSPSKEPAPTRGERADIKKPVDQIGLSKADFTQRPEDAFPTGEKRQPIKQHDNLYPEGQFYSPIKEAAPTRGERADIKKPVDQIEKSTADFTKRPEESMPTGEKRRPIKQQDNLYPEGQFYSPAKETAPTKGDRADIKRPVDQIGMSTADFTRRPEDVFPCAEKRQPIKQHDNLYPEGQFYSPEKQPAPVKGDRADIKKPVDQIGIPKGDFTRRPEDTFPAGEKRQPIKQHDNLYPEGQFYSPVKEAAPTKGDRAEIKKPVDQIGMSKADFTRRTEEVVVTSEKRQLIKQEDNLHPEGPFYAPIKEAAPTKGDRADIKKPVDQIGMSTADFTRRPEEAFPTGEKRQPIKQHDNLYPEGQFYSPAKEAAPTKGDRAEIKKPVDQIGMSTADFTRRTDEVFVTTEKRQLIKQQDNLHPEGPFYSPIKETAPTKGDRADIKKPVDQIGIPKGDFTRRPEEAAPTGEKRQPIKHHDNLYPEGQFYSPTKEAAPTKGDRADIKKPVDQIGMSTADFTQRPQDVFPTGEKRQPIKQHDNLHPEGQFYSPAKEAAPTKGDRADIKKPVDQIGVPKGDFTRRPEEAAPTGERRQPIKQHDNLYPEGQFYSPEKQKAPTKGDRADIKKPVDQIGIPKADFTRRPEEAAPTGEKRQPIKQHDNLYPEGQFYSPDKPKAPTKGDRADVKKPVDQIGMSKADFTRRPEEVIPAGERRQPIRKPDTLHPEGQFYAPDKQPAPGPGDRANVVKPKDQFLMPDGDFTQRPEQAFPHGEKRSPIRQKDNLRPEGQMYSSTKEEAPRVGERAPVKKPVDNLKTSDAKFYERPKETVVNGERRAPLKQVDNLHVEGEFYDRTKEVVHVRGERADKVIHEDTLRMEGKFHDSTTTGQDFQQYTGERADIVRHKDHLVTEGRFTGTSTTHEEHRQFIGQRAETVHHEDNLRTTGDFYKRPVEEAPKGEKRQPIRHKDNLYPEGQHYTPEKASAPGPGDRANIKKPVDNLKTPEGKFAERPKENMPITERRTQIRHEDSLKVEGEFYKRPKSPTVIKGERAPVKKPQDNLKMEGRMDILDKTLTVRKGERAEVIRHKDNLTVGEGSMELESISRSQQRESLRSRTQTSIINQQKSHQQHTRDVVRKQTSSQIILGDEAGYARFERTTTGKRNTVETRNLDNGHMLQETSIESSVRHTAETRATEDRSVEQKVLSQSMSAKSTVNQSILLNDVNEQRRQASIESNKHSSSVTTDSVNQVSATSASRHSTETRTQQQLQANKTGTREVNVTREVTVTKRQGDGGPGPRALPGTSTTTQNISSSSTVTDQSTAASKSTHHMSQQQMRSSSSSQQQQQLREGQAGYSSSRIHGTSDRGAINGDPSGPGGSSNKLTSHSQSQVLSNIQEGRTSSSTMESHSASSMKQNAAMSTSSHSLTVQGSPAAGRPNSPRNESVGRASPHSQSLSNIQEGRVTSSSATREHSSNVASSSSRQNSTSTHSRIIHGSSGPTSLGGTAEWSTRDNVAGSDSFANSLRSGGIQTSSNVSGSGNTLVIRHADVVDTRRAAGSATSHTGHCAIHSPQSRSAAGVRSSQQGQSTMSIGYSNNQQQSSYRDNSYNNNLTQNGSRSQRTVRSDNLSLSSQKFEGQTSSNYGHFQMTERVVPVRSTQQSSISLGSYHNSSSSPSHHPLTSSYKKEFTQRKVEPCPAALLESGKAPFKFERQSSSHRFYMPNVSD